MIADQAARDAALDPRRSFIVQAPAGSGKTTLLVERYLTLLKLVKQPEEILAITFTRKAAADMRKRVLEKVPAEIGHRLRIQTIDAFCASLARQMPVMSRFGALPDTVEDASGHFREAARRTLEALSPPVELLLAHLDNNVAAAASLIAAMLARRDQWLRKTGSAPTRAELEAALLFERNRLLGKAKALDPRASAQFAADVLTRQFTWRKKNAVARSLEGNEALREALAALPGMPPEGYDEAKWEVLGAILALLPLAAAQLKVVFAGRGECDFTEIAQGAVRALGTPEAPADLLLALDARINHVLVDEFQDTSISQWELISKLVSGWESDGNRTLFLVGDPMQSIYRFREAQVGLFLHARREGIGGVKLEPLTLTTNFRSQAGIVDWVNGCFPEVLPLNPDETSGAVPYSASTTHHPALPGGAVTWHCFFDRAAEANRVVQVIKNSPGKKAILIRNRNHLDHIVPALKEAGIRFRAVEIDALGEKQVVQDLYALTRALSHPADRIAWLAILRAPWVGLSLEDFSSFFENKINQTIWELIQDIPALDRFRNVLAPAIANRLRGTLRGRVEAAWLALGGPACVEDPTGLEDAEVFLDELEHLEEAGAVDMQALAEKLEKLWALPEVAAGPDAVEIMTIHKAKGLEFDTVIVPGLDRAPRSGAKPLLVWKSLPGNQLLLAPINETGAGDDPIYDYVRDLDREAEDIEAGRLLYVAATRAESRLHLLACAKANDDGTAKEPAKRSLLAKIWFDAAPHFGPAPAEAIEESLPVSIPGTLRRLPADFAMPSAPAPAKWTAPPEGREEPDIEFSWAGETARHVGTVVHRWLQRIAEDELKGWDAKRIESLRPRFRRELERRGVHSSGLIAASDLVTAALKNTIADERGRWLLGPHPVARNEYRLRNRLRSFRIDRYIEDKQGTKWVVDYKTSEHEGGGVEAFLDVQRDRYAAQLDGYAEAVGGASRGIYFPLHKGWRSW